MSHLIETRAASTANVVYRALQQFMKWLIDEAIDRSPMERMKPPFVPERPVAVLTEDQLRTLPAGAQSNTFVDRRDNAIMRLLRDTGGRLSEVAGLAVTDLDSRTADTAEREARLLAERKRPRPTTSAEDVGDVASPRRTCSATRRNVTEGSRQPLRGGAACSTTPSDFPSWRTRVPEWSDGEELSGRKAFDVWRFTKADRAIPWDWADMADREKAQWICPQSGDGHSGVVVLPEA